MQTIRPRVVLLTGASGTLGSEILQCYLDAGDGIDIRVLIRGAPEQARDKFSTLIAGLDNAAHRETAQRVRPVWGDLRQPDLGLPDHAYRELTGCVTDIVHSAAAIDFALPIEAARTANYFGTRHLVDLARSCPHLRAFGHVSTAHVAGKRTGLVTENELEHNAGFVNSYEQSKYEAEQYLRSVMCELPIAVYRSTTLIGDSRSGQVRQFNFFHRAMYLAYHGLIPAIPGVPDGPVDLIPVDYAARAIHYLMEDGFRPGATYHLCAGPENSFTLQALLEESYCIFQSSGARTQAVKALPIVDSSTFDRLLRDYHDKKHGRQAQVLAPLSYFLPHLERPKIFDRSQTLRDLKPAELQVPNIRSYYRPILEYCVRTNWGRRIPEKQHPGRCTEQS